VQRYKLAVFALSAFLAGLGGGLFAVAHEFVALDVLHWTTSGKAVIVVVLGGIGTLWGPVVGAALITRLEDWLGFAGFEQVNLVTGAIFVVAVLLFRRGIWGTLARLRRPHPR
jgi:branched-chain amino acid transport system permease protein